jgi:hypothetical protein
VSAPLPPGVAGERLLTFLAGYLGHGEVPPGSNRGPLVQTIQQATWLPGTGWPWCVATDIWSWESVFRLQHPYPTASVAQKATWARNNGLAVLPSQAKRGDAACLGNGRHITRIVDIRRGDGTFVGRGGNQGDMLRDSVYRIADIHTVVSADREARLLGVTRDDLPNLPPPKPPKVKPVYEIVRGDGERARVVFTARSLETVNRKIADLFSKGVKALRVRKRKPDPPKLGDDGGKVD